MKSFKTILIYILIITIITNCARRGNPSGGPKDINAPITIKTIPDYNSVNFSSKEISIYFDEYIKLKDLNKNLIISPPLKYNAEITPLGLPSKKISIKIKDTLLENTTYIFDFGESIQDNTEGNVLKNFKYIFSTGSYIDSLSIKGTLKDALNKETDKYVTIMLYADNKKFNDSTIYKNKPLYVTNSLDSIGWEITNLRKGKYHLIALKKEGNELVFNPKTDKLAYLDTLISIPTGKEFNLNLFKETLDFKSFKPFEVAKGHIQFGFQGDVRGFKVKTHFNQSGIKLISNIQFPEKGKDTLNYFYLINKPVDTIFFDVFNTAYKTTYKIKLRKNELDSLKIKSTIRGTLNFKDTLSLEVNNPLKSFDKSLFSILDKDTIAIDFSLKQKGYQNLLVIFKANESQTYKIKLLPNAITDLFNQKNKDTLNYTLKTKKKDNYGSVSLNINNPNKKSVIIQLLNTKEEVIEQRFNIKNKADFELLKPAKYLIRIIYDDNNNGKWDTGNYLKKQQPEKVEYFNKEIEVKENWFVNETIDIK